MKALAPDLFQRRFGDLMKIGRARLPALAPDWTDHNAHDPGITLMELLAWVAEAQLYSLSRSRRDERRAYAALLGVVPAGTQAARGLIWSDPSDVGSPAATFARTVVIPSDALITVLNTDTPTFRPTHTLLWAPGKLETLETRNRGGRTTGLTALNRRGGSAYLPFGESAGPHDVLVLTFRCRDDEGLFGPDRAKARDALWSIGVRAAPSLGGESVRTEEPCEIARTPLVATLIAGDERYPVEIVSDSTKGFLTTGALLLDLTRVSGSPKGFTIELQSPGGFPRPPRVLRIEPNVIPIEQGRSISREPHNSAGAPDWSFDLEEPGLRFSAGQPPVSVEVAESSGGLTTWRQCDRLSERGPGENVYELDPSKERITFGNGLNGRIAPAGSQVFVSYTVSDAEGGGGARNHKWKVAGFGGIFGVNPDPVTGGASASAETELRREARRRARDDHALVSSADIIAAARKLPLLEVARAWVVPIDEKTPQTGIVRLVAMRRRSSDAEPRVVPETPRWLEAIRRRLAPGMPLGTRLIVTAPRYVRFTIRATIETDPGRAPGTVKAAIAEALRTRLALVATSEKAARRAGVPVTGRDVKAWIRGVNGVGRIVELRLAGATGRTENEIRVPRSGLPRWDEAASDIEVSRPGTEAGS